MNQHMLSLALSAVRFSSCSARFSLTHMNAESIHEMALPSWEADVVRHNSLSRLGRDEWVMVRGSTRLARATC